MATGAQSYAVRDTRLYALGLGLGQDPQDAWQLAYLDPSEPVVVPTQAAVLAGASDWMRDPRHGIDWRRLVALSHRLEWLAPLPASGTVRSRVEIGEVFDRGADRGAILHWRRHLFDQDGRPLAVLHARALARGNGGFGGPASPREALPTPPGPPAVVWRWPTHPAQAQWYALSGDDNPLHRDPAVARAAGFVRPVLHGLCSLGICCLALLRASESQPRTRWRSLSGRYAGVAYPGETLQVELWPDAGARFRFRCRVVERDTVVIDDGEAILAADDAAATVGSPP